jgi:hypothetical protein
VTFLLTIDAGNTVLVVAFVLRERTFAFLFLSLP